MKTEPTWYLLYGGSSEDGRGPGVYEGRTTDVKVALAFRKKLDKVGPYSTGYVHAVTDTIIRHMTLDDLKQIKAAGEKA